MVVFVVVFTFGFFGWDGGCRPQRVAREPGGKAAKGGGDRVGD